MEWFDIHDANDAELDRLAERYHLHALHVAQAKAPAPRRGGIDHGPGYLFVGLDAMGIFVGGDFLITVRNGDAPPSISAPLRPDEALHSILEGAGPPDAILPIVAYLQDVDNGIVGREMRPFFRGLHRRLARSIEEAKEQRELEAAAVAVLTNKLLKALVALAALIAVLLIVMLYRWGA